MMFITLSASSQLTVEIGASRTDLEKAALTIGINYLRSLDSIFGDQELFVPGKRSFFTLTPELDIQTGTEDAFSSIVLKATGMINTFKTTEVAGLITPDYNKTFHSFPISLGAETNNQFTNTNAILEVGWVPYYQSYGRASPEWVKRTSFGIFVQAGYKINLDSSGVGGEEIESEEKEDKGILRAKGTFKIDTDELVRVGGIRLGLVGSADGWADIANSAFYHRLDGRLRVYLTDGQMFDFIWQSGSGAPLFNKASQVGVGVRIKF